MSRYIDAEDLTKKRYVKETYRNSFTGEESKIFTGERRYVTYAEIDEMPEAIVRCKDCKFFEPVSEYSGNCYRNEINNIFDGYCNKAERRESDADIH